MGSNTSKSNTQTAAFSQNNELDEDVSSNSDPRSPTPEITRTPLQNKNGAKHNITKNVDLSKTFESGKREGKLIHNNPILSAVIKNHLQSYDPRSPTQEFERTPIQMSKNIGEDTDEKFHKLENSFESPSLKNDTFDNNNCDTSLDVEKIKQELVVPKNLYDQFIDLSLNATMKESEEPLGSSTASNEVIENEMSRECSKPTKLLETNFDYVENETDKLEERNEDIETGDESIETLQMHDIKNVPLFKILTEDPRSPSTGIERTPIIVPKIEQIVDEGNVEDMSDDSLIKALQNTNSELCHVQDQNSDGILIYEDESKSIDNTPKKSKSDINDGSRTPLSCMKNKTDTTHARSNYTNSLLDNKKKAKLHKRVSKIPQLKSLVTQSKCIHRGSSVSLKSISKTSPISGDCENTPPHSHRDRWDKDNSIVL